MRDEAAFLELILKNPDDDGPRLVCADWLEENGRCDRAEFIRIQCELAQLRPDDPRRPKLEARERQLLLDHRQEWEPTFERPYVGSNVAFEFYRGFPELVTDAQSFLELEYQFAAGFPVPAVHLIGETHNSENDYREFWQRLIEYPFLDRVVELQVAVLENDALPLLESASLTRLQKSHLVCIGMAAAQAYLLSQCPAMASIQEWGLNIDDVAEATDDSHLSPIDAAARGIAESPYISALQILSLGSNDLTNEGAIALAASPQLSSVRRLDLGSNQISERGALALANSPYFEKVEWLNLAYNFPGPRGEEALRKRFGDRVHLR